METEAAAVAARIREMVGNEEVVDKETGEYRKIQYRDIVILLRAVSGWSETFFARTAGGWNSGLQYIKNGILFHAGNCDGAELPASV